MSGAMERTKSTSDENASVVVVTPPESTSEKKQEDDEPADVQSGDKEENKGAEEKDEKKVMVGTVSDSKDLYAKYDENGNRSWSEKPPDDLEEAAENEETQKYAVLVRKLKPKEADSSKSLVIDSLIIQSPYLKRVLSKVFDGYPSIVTKVSRLTFSAPFECFVHRWDQFTAAKDDPENDQVTRQHIEVLYDIMKPELGEIIQLREDYFNNRVIAWEHVWVLFPPGCTVLTTKFGRLCAIRFRSGHYAKTSCGNVYAMECESVDWDGTIMGWTDCNRQIGQYLGAKSFSELPCYPLEYHPQPDAAKAMLVGRGRAFESLAGYHYKAYSGTALYHPEVNKDKTRMETVQSRIVVDGANWEKCNPDNMVYLANIHKYDDPVRSRSRQGSLSSDSRSSFNSDSVEVEGEERKRAPLTEYQLLMTGPIVRGYALKNKRWMQFFIDSISEIEFDDRAFDSLVLPEDQKDLILAFAQSQVKYKHAFDDIISGKGKGIIMLLSGGPGIGKTLTAESVAEEMRVPLYIMSAGDLGSNAQDVEENLGQILSMVANWNAVLLLDECDVFLEERTASDMERNRIVGIFLRLLEYYEGCLFLTTNRVKSMDPAFHSRIHMSLEYPPLDLEARAAIWRGFLGRTVSLDKELKGDQAHEVTEAEVSDVSRLDLNGRQIKNVLKMANLLACQKKEKLKFDHIRKVLKVEGHSL